MKPFIAIAFRGRGRYDRLEADTLEEARSIAGSLHRGRPVGIYRAGPDGRSEHLENWEPERR